MNRLLLAVLGLAVAVVAGKYFLQFFMKIFEKRVKGPLKNYCSYSVHLCTVLYSTVVNLLGGFFFGGGRDFPILFFQKYNGNPAAPMVSM